MLPIHSLRLRLSLLSALLSGLVLGAFGAISWVTIWRANLNRLDSELRSQLLQEFAALHVDRDWNQHEKEIKQNWQQKGIPDITLWMSESTGKTIYLSQGWPKLIALDRLPFPFPHVAPSDVRPPFGGSPHGATPALFTPPQGAVFPPPDRRLETPQNPPPPPADFPPPPPNHQQPHLKLQALYKQGNAWRIGLVASPQRKLAIAVNLNSLEMQMSPIKTAFLIAFPVALLPIAVSAWLLSNRALRPVQHLTQAVQGVTAEGLDRRLTLRGEDLEFQSLILVFNQMMERLESSFHQARRFSADAAHELKTPLTILQGEIERSLQRSETDPATQQTFTNLLEETQRLNSIVRKLLLLSLADAGQLPVNPELFNFSEVIEESVEDTWMLAPHLKIDAEIPPDIQIMGDPILLRQVVQNLTSNAMKYNLPDGYIRFQLGGDSRRVWLQVTNPSHPLSNEDKQRLFERFYRASPSRDRSVEGLGLGLSLSREIARAHHGDLVCTQSSSGKVCFTLTLTRKI